MDYNSEEDSDLSEFELYDYSEKLYELLTTAKYKVKNLNETLRCPYCAAGKKNTRVQI